MAELTMAPGGEWKDCRPVERLPGPAAEGT